MASFAAAYADARTRIQELAGSLPPEDLGRQVPGCPEWSVKDLVAHLTGIAADAVAGNLGDIGGREWTAAQVSARRERPLPDIFAEWNEVASQIEATMDGLHPTIAGSFVGDIITHEHDLRDALENRDARDTDGVILAGAFYAREFGKRLKGAGLPTITLNAGDHEWTAGVEEPVGTVRAPLFEMLRGLTGRRTSDEVKGFDWSIDAAPYLEIFSMYPVTEASLDE